MSRTLAVCCQKGGVGKTTVAVNLADVWAHQGLRVLLVDADPQANASAHVGLGEEPPPYTLYDVLTDARPGVLADAVHKAGEGWHGIQVVTAALALDALNRDGTLGREARLRTAMRGLEEEWDVVLVDCPPSLGLLTVNALVAADTALVVTEPRAAAYDGVATMLDTCATVQEHYNAALRVSGVLVNKYRDRRRDSAGWVTQLREAYPQLVLEPYVVEREVVAQSTTAALPLSHYTDGSAAAAEVYGQLETLAAALLEETR